MHSKFNALPRAAVAVAATALSLTGVAMAVAPSADAAGSCVFSNHREQDYGVGGFYTVAYGKKVVCPNAGAARYAIRINCSDGSTATGPYVTAGKVSGVTCSKRIVVYPLIVTNYYIVTA